MSTPTQEPAGATPAVPTPAEAVAAGQIPAQAPTPPAQAPTPPAAAPSPASAAPVQPAESGKPAEPTDWEAEAAKWKSLARRHEGKHLDALGFKSKDEITQLRQAAQKYGEFEETQKSEIQRATERAQTFEQQLADERAQNARLLAAAAHSIPPELIELLGSGTAEEIGARAEVLAERLKAAAPALAPASQRPVESLTPGAAPASAVATSPDDWIRQATGRKP